MKKTHQDRINLIDRSERKYARKLQLKSQERRQHMKNALRAMRGRRADIRHAQAESIDGIFTYGTRATS